MIIEELYNYPPRMYLLSRTTGSAYIALRRVSDNEKVEIEQLADDMFVRNEFLSENLHLSHEPDNIMKRSIRRCVPFGRRFFNEYGLKKIRDDNLGVGCTIYYESGRHIPWVIFPLKYDYYRAEMIIGSVGYHPADGVDVFVYLHSQEYGDILINKIIEQFNPDFSEKLMERKRVKGRYEKRVVAEV